jgi:hypothetical protein
MATYKIDRSRNLSFIGKFKFNYEVVFGNDQAGELAGPTNGQTFFTTGSYVKFDYSDKLFVGSCAVANRDPEDNQDNIALYLNGDGAISNFGPNLFNTFNKTASVKFSYNLKAAQFGGETGGSVRDSFILATVPFDANNFDVVAVSGTIEGVMYYGTPMNEFVGIDEYYPSENYFIPAGNNCGDDEFWKLRKLDEKTIRQWPKYTTLNWFEAPDTSKKSVMGILIKHTDSNGKTQFYS